MCASPCWTRWRVGTKRNETLLNIQWQQNTNPKKRVRDDGSDMDSDNKMLMNSETIQKGFNSEGFSGYSRNPEEH